MFHWHAVTVHIHTVLWLGCSSVFPFSTCIITSHLLSDPQGWVVHLLFPSACCIRRSICFVCVDLMVGLFICFSLLHVASLLCRIHLHAVCLLRPRYRHVL